MIPKKADWNRCIPVGDGVCHCCKGAGKDPTTLRDLRCRDCQGTGICDWCGGSGIHKGWNCRFCNNLHQTADETYYQAVGKHTTIRELLAEICEEETARRIWRRCDAARESFALDRITVDSRSEYRDILGKYMTHYSERAMFHDHMNPDNPFLTAEYILEKTRGSARISYECARSGELGGMKGLLDSIHEFAKGILTERVLKSTLDYFHVPERVRLMEEYLAVHGATHLPRQFQGQSAIVLGDRYFSEVLTHHVLVVEPALRAEAERA